ncbi:response regulator transcription factor [Lutibacter citreus]|uniref:response regulator transcription factor n=1 Tax=Lutibacter citreus TaxID=2138210 RepID=UPI000DBE9609|nr:LuxR C-terminal-related transcriptional regulator [Lutibacter citreus]
MFKKYRIIFLCCFLFSLNTFSQFKFKGQVNNDFFETKAYLILIDDYKKGNLFLTDQIIQETNVDSLGFFQFSGNFLSNQNKFYKIHIDQCNNSISDYKHLLNNCADSSSIIFIANNSDTIYFPLNNIDQMFCSLEFSRTQNIAIKKIDSVKEVLLYNLQDSRNEKQREILFNEFIKKIQNFSFSLNEPLTELYAYQLYASRTSFSRELYIKDLKNSNYYNSLLSRLKEQYPTSIYTSQFENDLLLDEHYHIAKKSSYLVSLLVFLIAILIAFIVLILRKNKKNTIDYRKLLSKQEQKIFELMNKGLANKEIAENLFISISTVKTHINNIYTKLKINSRKDISQFF